MKVPRCSRCHFSRVLLGVSLTRTSQSVLAGFPCCLAALAILCSHGCHAADGDDSIPDFEDVPFPSPVPVESGSPKVSECFARFYCARGIR